MVDQNQEEEQQQVEVPVGEPERLYCWMDPSRECGADCVAYDVRYIDDRRFNPCLLLNIGRSLMVSISGIDKALVHGRQRAANEELRRMVDVPPPPVR